MHTRLTGISQFYLYHVFCVKENTMTFENSKDCLFKSWRHDINDNLTWYYGESQNTENRKVIFKCMFSIISTTLQSLNLKVRASQRLSIICVLSVFPVISKLKISSKDSMFIHAAGSCCSHYGRVFFTILVKLTQVTREIPHIHAETSLYRLSTSPVLSWKGGLCLWDPTQIF